MWNQSDSDRKYYERKAIHKEKRREALDMAKARGKAAEEWSKLNKLTVETLPAFKKLMKGGDKKFRKLYT